MDISKFRRFKWGSLIIWAVIGCMSVLTAIIGMTNGNYFFAFLLIIGLFCFILSLVSLMVNYKQYDVDGNRVLCYAGWEKHYLIINGELVDEYVSAFSFTPIELRYKDEKHEYYVRVSLSNSITLKVDGKLIK